MRSIRVCWRDTKQNLFLARCTIVDASFGKSAFYILFISVNVVLSCIPERYELVLQRFLERRERIGTHLATVIDPMALYVLLEMLGRSVWVERRRNGVGGRLAKLLADIP